MKKSYWIIIVSLLVVIAILLGYLVIKDFSDQKRVNDTASALEKYKVESADNCDDCPVDFEKLINDNPDIYAWIDIPGTNVSYPVLNRPGNDEFYLNHDMFGNYSVNGCIYTEDYNSRDFSDPVTVLYGHHMRKGDMFGELERYYSDEEFFKQNNDLTIYTNSVKIKYKIFAAVPFSNVHLLHYNDFSNIVVYKQFFKHISEIKAVNANVNEEYIPKYGQKVVVLSTCLSGNNSNRYLVFAVEV